MRKISVLLVLAFLICLPLSAQAATPRALLVRPNISYSGNVATCTVNIYGNTTSDYLEATIKLWHGTSCIKTWEETGNGYIFFSETATITPGNTHTLTVDLWVNGVAQDRVSITK